MLWELLPLVVVVLFFFVLVIRPARRRALETSALQAALQVGDRVILTSGFYGTVHALADDSIELDLGPGIVTVARGAVGGLVRPDTDGADGAVADVSAPHPSGTGAAHEHLDVPDDLDHTAPDTAPAAPEAGDPKEG